MLSRLAATLTACCIALAGLAPAAGAAEPGYTVTDHKIEVTDGPADDQQVTIDADLYVPDGVTAANRAPVVINAHGFNGSEETNDNNMNEVLTKAGYVVFAYSSRGFGETTDKIGLDSVDYDVKDVAQLIDWLAEHADEHGIELDGANDPRLGMVGPSYGGGIQLQMAGTDDRVDVIVPYITWHSLLSSLSPNYLNTDLRLQEGRPVGIFKQEWTSLFFASGNAQVLTSPPGTDLNGEPCLNFVEPLCRVYFESVAAGRATPETIEILKASSPATAPRLDNIDIPTLLIQGQSDTLFTPNEAAANYTAIQGNGAPVKMIWHDGGHGYPYAKGELAFLQQRTVAWFDRHLRNDSDADTGPGFEYYRRWADGDGAQRYAAAGSFPVGTRVPLYLSGDGSLQTSKSAAGAGDVSWLSQPAVTSYSETSNFQNTDPFKQMPATDPPANVALFTTPPLDKTATVVGIPTVQFPLTSTIGEAQLFAKIYDVAPDGSTALVRRMVAPIRATDLPGVLEAQLVGIAHRFEAGHSIRLALASTDAAYANLRTPTTYTMSIKPGEAVLRLPLVGAKAVAPAKGTKSTGAGGKTGQKSGAGVAAAGAGRQPTLPATGGGAAALPGMAMVLGAFALHRRRR